MTVAVILFGTALGVIASERVHRTKVALAGATLILLTGTLNQEEAIAAVDFNTIGLLVGMMVMVRITEATGVYTWLAIRAGQWSGGRPLAVVLSLSLAAGADTAKGGSVSLLVPWPTLPGADELARAVAATRAAGDITVYEAVTSDTATSSGQPQPLDVTAEFFVSQEPYAAGTAPQAARLAAGTGATRLALGYPAASINVLLTLDRAGRIVDETLTDPRHLVTRRIVYPEPD